MRHILFAHETAGKIGDALEVGAEGGRWSRVLAERGWSMTCTDINGKALRVCQERIPTSECILVDQESTALPAKDDSHDMVLCIEVGEVLESSWFLSELDRVLRPGGQLVCVFQNRDSLRALFRRQYTNRETTDPQYNVGYADWRRRLRASGFSISKEEGMCWMPFPRSSDSRMIPFFTFFEKAAGLRRFTSLSPWITLVAKKEKPRRTLN